MEGIYPLTVTLTKKKEFDEIQTGTGCISRQFLYHAGLATEKHLDSGKVKSTPTTNLVSQIILSDGRTISYEYDAEERISRVIDSLEGTIGYTYDAQGQLTEEFMEVTSSTGEVRKVTLTAMTYDAYGNILTKNGNAYTYGNTTWKDLLTAYNGQSISYDAQGNPTTYLGHTLTWEKGHQLKSFDSNTYTYNANGIRTSKTVDGVEHIYTLDGTKILRETWDGNTLIPLYDNEETVCGIIYNGNPYYFLKNLQGDVIAICDQNGKTKARYMYDPWGACIVSANDSSSNIANINPFRYRGYYYDAEIGMYYLQSRYYNPTLGRFVNGDEILYAVVKIALITTNSFAYCVNCSINYADTEGTDAVWLQDNKGVFGAGHTGLVFQHRSNWYYWYWGPDFNALSSQFITELVRAAQKIIELWKQNTTFTQNVLNTLKGSYRLIDSTVRAETKLTKVVPKKAVTSTNYKTQLIPLVNKLYPSKKIMKLVLTDKFSSFLYIKGNFDQAYSCFKELENMRNYKLLSNNCMQTTINGLLRGEFTSSSSTKKEKLKKAKSLIVPNAAYNYLKFLL